MLLSAIAIAGCVHTPAPLPATGGINSQSPDEHPAFSANGRYLAFASDRHRSRNIYLYDLEQRQMVPLPNLNRPNSSQDQPALSADGQLIAYVSTERGRTDIFIYDRATATPQLLTFNIRGSVRHPTISGDGRFVAFETSRLGQWHIEIVDRGVGSSSSGNSN